MNGSTSARSPPNAATVSGAAAAIGSDVDERGPLDGRDRHGVEAGTRQRGRELVRDELGAGERDLEHREGLRAELLEAPVAVATGAEVDLRDRLGAGMLGCVEEQAQVDAVALDERELLEQAATACVLAAQRLDDAGEMREEQGDHRSGGQLGDAAATVSPGLERPVVEALDERDVGLGQQRPDETDDEPLGEVGDVGVAPDDEIAGGGVERFPQRVALAFARTGVGQHIDRADDTSPGRGRRRAGAVGRAVVDHHDLVDERHSLDELGADGLDDVADRRHLVARGHANRDGVRALGVDEVTRVEIAVGEGLEERPSHASIATGGAAEWQPHAVAASILLRCAACGAVSRSELAAWCDECMGPLAIEHDWPMLAPTARAAIEAGPDSMWRYASLLGIEPASGATPAGWTPLVPAPELGAAVGIDDLWVKDETANPTRSFKDRVVGTALSTAVARGFEVVACASTGNLARSLAVNAPAFGLRAVVLVPSSLDRAAQERLAAYGALVVAVDGPYDAANRLSVEAAMELDDVAWVNVSLRPWYLEGGATVGFEIVEQLGWVLPDHVVAPMASGALVCRIAGAFEAARELGLVDGASVTRISTAQPAGCAPVARAFASGARSVAPVRADTVATSLAMGDPPEGDDVLALARATGGAVLAADEHRISDDTDLVRTATGIDVEPAGGVVAGVLRRLATEGHIAAGKRVVAVLTGGVADDLAPTGVSSLVPVTIDPTLTALRAVLDT